MSFTGNEDHSITLTAAAAMTEDYRTNNSGSPLGVFFGKDAIQDILDQIDCVGIRCYFAEKSDGTPTLILVGAKANEDDLENGDLAEYGLPDPPYNSAANSLNS
jgi:hypothetical protein